MSPVVWWMTALLFASALFNFLALSVLHAPVWSQMDFYDHAARGGIAAGYLALAVGAGLLMLQAGGLEWRLPLVVVTSVITSVGLARNVRRL